MDRVSDKQVVWKKEFNNCVRNLYNSAKMHLIQKVT